MVGQGYLLQDMELWTKLEEEANIVNLFQGVHSCLYSVHQMDFAFYTQLSFYFWNFYNALCTYGLLCFQ